MNRKSTSDETSHLQNSTRGKEVIGLLLPSEKTLDYIRRFAYSYHAETKLPNSLSGMVLN